MSYSFDFCDFQTERMLLSMRLNSSRLESIVRFAEAFLQLSLNINI